MVFLGLLAYAIKNLLIIYNNYSYKNNLEFARLFQTMIKLR